MVILKLPLIVFQKNDDKTVWKLAHWHFITDLLCTREMEHWLDQHSYGLMLFSLQTSFDFFFSTTLKSLPAKIKPFANFASVKLSD